VQELVRVLLQAKLMNLQIDQQISLNYFSSFGATFRKIFILGDFSKA
jgi:hypothetical protein